MDKKIIAGEVRKLAESITAMSNEDEKTKWNRIDKETKELCDKLKWTDAKKLVEVSWFSGTYYFSKTLDVKGMVTGTWIGSPKDLKYYSDAYAKADKAYQDGKKKFEEYAKKNDLKIKFTE